VAGSSHFAIPNKPSLGGVAETGREYRGNIVSPPTLVINFTQLTYYPHDENGTVYSTAVAHETRRRQLAAQDKQTPCPTSTGTHQ